MITRRGCLGWLAGVAAWPARAQQMMGYPVPVQGQLFSRARNSSVPGVTVFLVHQVLGRSAPSISDVYGRFGWSAIPVRPEPYFLEIYWGQTIIYRQQIGVFGPTMLPMIYL